ncbi:MAG TPA: hypothetical protein VM598_03070 [Bdellovibrionota bacterium]|nr:hypothetical protein [Bdellovibrionota bacterium]
MRKSVVAALVAASIASHSFSPPRAEAAAGVILLGAGGAGIPLLVTGGVVVAGGATLTFVVGPLVGGWEGLFWLLLGIPVMAVGVLILDEDVHAVAYKELTAEQAASLELREPERQAFNDELAEINAEAQAIARKLSSLREPKVEDAAMMWKDSAARLSPEAMTALERVSARMHEDLHRAISR